MGLFNIYLTAFAMVKAEHKYFPNFLISVYLIVDTMITIIYKYFKSIGMYHEAEGSKFKKEITDLNRNEQLVSSGFQGL